MPWGVVSFLSILSVLVVLTFHSSWQHVWIVDIFACPWMTWDWLRHEELFSFIWVLAFVVVLTFGSFKWYFVDILACPGKTWDWLRHESLCAMRSAPEVLARAGPWCPPPSSWCPPPTPPGAHGSRLHGFQLDGTASQKNDPMQRLLKKLAKVQLEIYERGKGWKGRGVERRLTERGSQGTNRLTWILRTPTSQQPGRVTTFVYRCRNDNRNTLWQSLMCSNRFVILCREARNTLNGHSFVIGGRLKVKKWSIGHSHCCCMNDIAAMYVSENRQIWFI